MTTITFTYQGKSKEVYQNEAFIAEYSENPEALAKIIRELTGLTCDLSIDKASWDDKARLKSNVTIGYCGKKLQFDFYHSLKDTEEWGIDEYYQPKKGGTLIKAKRLDSEFLKDVLYSLLCSIRSEVGIHEFDFAEFCADYGYDEDSCKAHETYEKGCNFSRKIARVFSDDELASFPY